MYSVTLTVVTITSEYKKKELTSKKQYISKALSFEIVFIKLHRIHFLIVFCQSLSAVFDVFNVCFGKISPAFRSYD